MKILRLTCIFFALVFCFSMNSCIFNAEIQPDLDKAHIFIEKFFSTISSGKIECAEEYLHPHFLQEEGNLANYLAELEEDEKIDFSKGIFIENMKSQSSGSSTYSNYRYEGYVITYNLWIGNVRKSCEVKVCDNDDGYGIYHIKFDN